MPRLILLLAVIAVVYILLQRIRSQPPHLRRMQYTKLGLGVALVAVIFLTVTGRMHWVGAALTGLLVLVRQLLPTLLRAFPVLASLWGRRAPAQGQSSTVATDILRMQLDHDSGNLQGEVLRGTYQGWHLADMNRAQLEELLAYCRSQDADSVQLLSSYLQQRFPGETHFGEQNAASDSGGNMARKEALAVLGLDETATEEDIVNAHRKLMQKLHPDRGGNDYLAAKINRAKDVLLGAG
ncbi:MAG: DnaJ domain-containing protein [Halioglobus sp.]|nr:DnaJ domain-containing protein [Halioglobus sp.]